MARDNLAKKANETDLQWRSRLARMKQEARDKNAPLVTPEAEAHGDYQNDFVTNVEDGTKAWTKINRGGHPVTRWITADKLSQTQQTVIAMCMRLWRLAGMKTAPLAAQYGERIGRSSCYELTATTAIEARDDLKRITGYFPGPLKDYWNVFENICRHGIPAGVAGAGNEYSTRTGQDRAHTIVCFVADIIATNERV